MELKDKQLEAKVNLIQDQHVQMLVCKARGQLLEQKHKMGAADRTTLNGKETSWNAMYTMMKHEAATMVDSKGVLEAEMMQLTDAFQMSSNKVKDQATKFESVLQAAREVHLKTKAKIGVELSELQSTIKALSAQKDRAIALLSETKQTKLDPEVNVPTAADVAELRTRLDSLQYAMRASIAERQSCDVVIEQLQEKSSQLRQILERPDLLLPKLQWREAPQGIQIAPRVFSHPPEQFDRLAPRCGRLKSTCNDWSLDLFE